jgi:hypothetical protein
MPNSQPHLSPEQEKALATGYTYCRAFAKPIFGVKMAIHGNLDHV